LKDLHFSAEYIQYADQAAKIPHWRLLRTEKSVEAAYKMQGMFKELNKRSGVENVLLCYYWEIGKFFDGVEIEKSVVSNRKDGYGLMITEQAIYDLDLQSRTALKSGIENQIKLGNAIKGNVACRGFVKGRVRILHNTKQLNSFKEGEILVTAMTTPEYVPIMRLASAIVTDEGGISCHAAIVSRELKIPCVIGTKNATKVLKDGDIVEVDAGKGIVTIIK
jgi:phosphohistidine swiveling domain-containing protein